jgi:hypothetical protein
VLWLTIRPLMRSTLRQVDFGKMTGLHKEKTSICRMQNWHHTLKLSAIN